MALPATADPACAGGPGLRQQGAGTGGGGRHGHPGADRGRGAPRRPQRALRRAPAPAPGEGPFPAMLVMAGVAGVSPELLASEGVAWIEFPSTDIGAETGQG